MPKTELNELYYDYQNYWVTDKAVLKTKYEEYCKDNPGEDISFEKWCESEDGFDYWQLKDWLTEMRMDMNRVKKFGDKDWLESLCDELESIKYDLEDGYGWSKDEINNLITEIWGEEGVPECLRKN